MEITKEKNFFLFAFIISDYLLETKGISIVVFFFISLIEFLQICYFYINPLFEKYWDNEILFNGICNFLRYFWVDKIFSEKNDFNGFLVIFYIFVILLLVLILDIIYILFALDKNYSIRLIPKIYFLIMMNIFVQIFFIPMLSTFSTVYMCSKENVDKDNPSVINAKYYYNYFFPNTKCFQGTQIAHCLFGIIFIFIICIIGYILSAICFETNPKSRNLTSRFRSSFEVAFFVNKIIGVAVYNLSTFFLRERKWIIVVSNCIISMINCVLLLKEKPFFNVYVNKILMIFRLIEFSTALLLLFAVVLGENNFEGEWLIFFMSVILIIAVVLLFPDNKFKIILSNPDSIKDENFFQKKLIYTFDLIENQDMMDLELFLKGYIIGNSNLIETSLYLDELKVKVEAIARTPNEKCKKHAEEYIAFQKYINECYKKGLKKFPGSNSLRLNYLMFSIRYLQNPQLSMMIMKQIDNKSLSLEEKFIFYRYSKIVEERLMIHNPNAVKVDVNFEITYKRYKNIFIKLIEKTTLYLTDFWDIISRENTKITTVEELVYKINRNLNSLGNIWKEILRLKTNDNKVIFIYEKFLKNVLNDEQGAEELLAKYVDLQQGITSSEENILGEYETYIQDGSGYVIASGNTETLGRIISFNPSFARAFNYTYPELKGKTINILIPELFREEHQSKLFSLAITDDFREKASKNFGRLSVVGLKKTGYIFPLNITVTTITGVNDSINFLALIKTPPSDNFKPYPIYFLTDENFDIRNVSSEAIPIFGINSNNISYINYRNSTIQSTNVSRQTSVNMYLNLTLLISELEKIREDKYFLENCKGINGLNQRKKISIMDTSELMNVLSKSAEKNKAVKLLDISITNANDGTEDAIPYKKFNHIFNQKFKDFYISLHQVRISNNLLGYIIKLEPIKEENYLMDTKNIINYEENILAFDPNHYRFCSQESSDLPFLKGKQFSQMNLMKTTLPFKRKNRNFHDTDFQAGFCTNLLNYLFKKNNIKNYGDIQKVKTIIRVQGKPDKEIPQIKAMKIEESIKKIDAILRNSKDKELTVYIFDDDKNDQQNILEKSTEDLLNFKGIEGWKVISSKIKKSKIPSNIIILRTVIIIVYLVFLTCMVLHFIYEMSKLEHLDQIVSIQNLTLVHSHYTMDSIDRAEMYFFYFNHENRSSFQAEEEKAKNKLSSNIVSLLNTTNNLREISSIDKEEYKFFTNRDFVMLSTFGNEQVVQMNLIEIFIQLINKLLGLLTADNVNGKLDNYNLFMINVSNVYLATLIEIISNFSQLFTSLSSKLERNLRLFLYLALTTVLLTLMNIWLGIRMNSLKKRIVELFLTIPERICWKYHSNCEWFIKYIHDVDNIFLDKSKEDNNNSNHFVATAQNKKHISHLHTITTIRTDNFQKRSLSSIGSERKKISSQNVIYQIIINLFIFFALFSYYVFGFVIFSIKKDDMSLICEYANYSFLLKYSINFYAVNQRRIFSGNKVPVLGMENLEFQQRYFLYTNQLFDFFINSWYKRGIKIFTKIKTDTGQDIFQILNEGECENAEFEEICKLIPKNYWGFFFVSKSIFENITQVYIDYTMKKYATPPTFEDAEYLKMNDILNDYVSPLMNEFYVNINNYLTKILNDIKHECIILIVIYLIVLFGFTALIWIIAQKKSLTDITYAKTALLLISPNDIKEMRYVMDYLQKELYSINSEN